MNGNANVASQADIDGKIFKLGEGVSWGAGTDTKSGTVVKITGNGRTVWVVEDDATLLNGSGSGAPDALTFTPGGFVGHTSGEQRYEFKPGSGDPMAFNFRPKTQRFKLKGTSTTGSMRGWGNLFHGRSKHRDFNF